MHNLPIHILATVLETAVSSSKFGFLFIFNAEFTVEDVGSTEKIQKSTYSLDEKDFLVYNILRKKDKEEVRKCEKQK